MKKMIAALILTMVAPLATAGLISTNGSETYLNESSFVTYTYEGGDAGWSNTILSVGGFFNNQTSVVGDSFTVFQNEGWLPYVILANDGIEGIFTNGLGFWNFLTDQNMRVAVEYLTANSVMVSVDDGGAGPDRDYNDLRFSIAAGTVSVPEPGTLVLLGMGLISLALLRRREVS